MSDNPEKTIRQVFVESAKAEEIHALIASVKTTEELRELYLRAMFDCASVGEQSDVREAYAVLLNRLSLE